jgi:hypothetical protein
VSGSRQAYGQAFPNPCRYCSHSTVNNLNCWHSTLEGPENKMQNCVLLYKLYHSWSEFYNEPTYVHFAVCPDSRQLRLLNASALLVPSSGIQCLQLIFNTSKMLTMVAWIVLCFTNCLTPWNRRLPEKLTGSQLLKKLPAFYGTRWFITAFTTASHLSLSWAISRQSMLAIRLL